MKKFLSILICFVMLFCITACGSTSGSDSASSSTSSSTSAPKPQVKFYEGTQFPTFDSVSIKGIKCTGEVSANSFLYGTYDNRMDLQIDINYYVEFVKEEYGYTCEYLSVADENTIKVIVTANQGTLILNAGLSSGVVLCGFTWNN